MPTSFLKNKQIVVTGGSGFIGSHFVEALLDEGAEVIVPIHQRPMVVKDKSIRLVRANLAEQAECRRVFKGCDYVIHAAGAVSAANVTSGNNPMSPITINLNLTAQVLEAAWTEGIERVLIFSSSTGYPVTDHPIKEEEMWTGPTHKSYFGYGWMRRYIERMCEFVSERSDTQVALIRPTATYGPYDDFDPKTSHVIPALIRRALLKENPFLVWGTGDEIRDFLYVKDLIQGCLAVLEKHALCDPINIGYGHATSIREVVEIIMQITGNSSTEIQFDASKPTTISKRMVNISKAKRLLGYEPKYTLKEGLNETLKWYTGVFC